MTVHFTLALLGTTSRRAWWSRVIARLERFASSPSDNDVPVPYPPTSWGGHWLTLIAHHRTPDLAFRLEVERNRAGCRALRVQLDFSPRGVLVKTGARPTAIAALRRPWRPLTGLGSSRNSGEEQQMVCGNDTRNRRQGGRWRHSA